MVGLRHKKYYNKETVTMLGQISGLITGPLLVRLKFPPCIKQNYLNTKHKNFILFSTIFTYYETIGENRTTDLMCVESITPTT